MLMLNQEGVKFEIKKVLLSTIKDFAFVVRRIFSY